MGVDMTMTDNDMQEFMEHSANRWMSLSYQGQILGGEMMEEYMEH